jgi:hypothetical protein
LFWSSPSLSQSGRADLMSGYFQLCDMRECTWSVWTSVSPSNGNEDFSLSHSPDCAHGAADPGSQPPGPTQLSRSLALGPQTRFFSTQCLSFPVYKMTVMIMLDPTL